MPLDIFSCWKSSSKISEDEESNGGFKQDQNVPKEGSSDMISRGNTLQK